MNNQVHIPTERSLADLVQFFWQVNTANSTFVQEKILPKGVVEVIFNFTHETEIHAELYDQNFTIPNCFIQGYHSSPIVINSPKRQLFFGVVFHAVAIKHILGVPAGEFAKQCIDLTKVDPSFHSLWHQLAEKKTFNERTEQLTYWLKKRMPSLTRKERILNDLFTLKTNRSLFVPSIAEWLCYSPRQLSRVFNDLTGMNSAKTLLYLKYLRSIQLLHHSNLSLTQIAYLSDFSDQSHFIKTFKSFTHITPKEYQTYKSDVVGHYFDSVR